MRSLVKEKETYALTFGTVCALLLPAFVLLPEWSDFILNTAVMGGLTLGLLYIATDVRSQRLATVKKDPPNG